MRPAALFAFGASAQTVILWDDGTRYTVKDGEHVYISDHRKLYVLKQYSKGDIKLTKVSPSDKRDYVRAFEPAGSVGSHEWCESYEPWGEGLTFDMVSWQVGCDVNSDGEIICATTTSLLASRHSRKLSGRTDVTMVSLGMDRDTFRLEVARVC